MEEGKGDGTVGQLIRTQVDVKAGVYEGGFKVWECTFDLLRYLQRTSFNFEGKSVIELGCGAGYPGLLALAHGAEHVDFQDYNRCVIDKWTVPNVLANSNASALSPPTPNLDPSRCRFFAGDWANPTDTFPTHYYDVVMMAETVYAQSSLQPLAALVSRCTRPGGVVLLAAKACYYGVGGSVAAFTKEMKARSDVSWTAEEVWTTSSGLRRVIMKYTRQP
ncbi:hypothetical protein PTSG_09536 [Salpingoeca rosetta]|uniref:protein-histidine N-methyltransferase n=1 Tax=Salpingoeca rosetta (strain ATCC 50818 / BSB-021) TaxID=946362 RepID=F2ULA2_SALR5|nr:uncharacterized protein PTSG_09536 [Salpingoeca rosetta]EGD77901.1 hypothetical protein PTSG_09536 [Salpingoeca rosetta]|eukprot:XP_004989965.1 hypothetical protein PTSG_09536 [Salpingoeca rosetta]